MTKMEKWAKCSEFFKALSDILKNEYEVVGSCNKDLSAYLVPIGTKQEISYYGKPNYSFRVSDHWNWYSNAKKCSNKEEVQCWSFDVPAPRRRDPKNPNMATLPRKAFQVAAYDSKTRQYYAVYGEVWNSVTKKWSWLETDPTDVAHLMRTLLATQ